MRRPIHPKVTPHAVDALVGLLDPQSRVELYDALQSILERQMARIASEPISASSPISAL